MRTSDVMDIGYIRFYREGNLESLNDVKINHKERLNKVKMTKDEDSYVIIDYIRDYGTTGHYSTLKLVADNDGLVISINSSIKINSPIDDELSFYKWLNKINQHESCTTSYDASAKRINTEAYICLVGYRFWHDESYLDTYEERPYFMSTPEIEGFINLLNQVTSRMSSVSKEIANYK